MAATAAPKLSNLTGPAGELGEARHPDDLPGWAVRARNALDKYDAKFFDGDAGAWIWQANSHELIDMIEEVHDLPDALWDQVIA